MSEEEVAERTQRDREQGKSPSTQAGEFVREEMHHVREGKHGARSPQQAIAIGLSKARRSGVQLPPPKRGQTSARVRAQAKRDTQRGHGARRREPSRTRSRATSKALAREGHSAVARHAHRAAQKRGPRARHLAAEKAVRTKGGTGLIRAARNAARTRNSADED